MIFHVMRCNVVRPKSVLILTRLTILFAAPELNFSKYLQSDFGVYTADFPQPVLTVSNEQPIILLISHVKIIIRKIT